MRKLLLAVLLLAVTATAADARRRGHGYLRTGPGPVVGIEALIPSDWRLAPQEQNWQGRRFVSPEGDAWLALYSSPADAQALDAHLKQVAFVEGEDITYLRREREWLVVSGFKGAKEDRIFYRKVVLACGGSTWRHIAFEYPAEAKRAFDRFVERVAVAMDQAARLDCNETVGRSN
jgi:serine/threonine-protein kinase